MGKKHFRGKNILEVKFDGSAKNVEVSFSKVL